LIVIIAKKCSGLRFNLIWAFNFFKKQVVSQEVYFSLKSHKEKTIVFLIIKNGTAY